MWPFLALMIILPASLFGTMAVVMNNDAFGIFDIRYIVIVVFALPILGLLTTFVLATMLPVHRRVPIATAIWIAGVGFLHFWIWAQFTASV